MYSNPWFLVGGAVWGQSRRCGLAGGSTSSGLGIEGSLSVSVLGVLDVSVRLGLATMPAYRHVSSR